MPDGLPALPDERGGLVRDPVYLQLNRRLVEWMRRRGLRPGDRFPSEREISERFGVSRVTANKALSQLVIGGRLEFRKGVGTFVRNGGFEHDLQSLVSFTHVALSAGKRPSTRVLRFEALPAARVPAAVRAALALGTTEGAWRIVRIRLADDEPLILERRHLSRTLCAGLRRADAAGSLYEALSRRCGLSITAATERIRAINLSAADAALLRVPPGSAALWLHGVARVGDRPAWVEDTVYRGDRYEFRNQLGGDARPGGAGLVFRGAGADPPVQE